MIYYFLIFSLLLVELSFLNFIKFYVEMRNEFFNIMRAISRD